MALEDLIAAYGDAYDELRLSTGQSVAELWLELGGPDDVRARQFAEAAVAVIDDAAATTGATTSAALDEYVGSVTRGPASRSSPLDLVELTVDQLRGGVSGVDVYDRLKLGVRKGLADGKPYDVAMAEAARRADAMAQSDVALAHRRAAQHTMSGNPAVDGYRRVLTGESCSLCRVASTQPYRTSDLMPIHPRCDCRVLPLVDGYDGGRIVNRELYRELKESGELAKLNRKNRGTTGRSRTAAARAARDARIRNGTATPYDLQSASVQQRRTAAAQARRKARIDTGAANSIERANYDRVAGELADLDDTVSIQAADLAEAPTVRLHGELGPVLVNERHAFTAARRNVDDVTDAGDLRRARPETPPTDSVDELPEPPAVDPPPPPRSPRYDPTNLNVVRAAQRRNMSPEDLVDELEAKRARRLADQADARQYERDLTVDHPDVIAVAERNGVTADEVIAARGEVAQVRRVIADEATRVQLDAFAELERAEALYMRRPPRGSKPAEYDWLEELDPAERKRLGRRWWDDGPTSSPDQLLARAQSAGILDDGADSGDLARWWLYHNRRYEAAGAIRRGKAPSSRAYSGNLDPDDIVELGDYRASAIVGKSDLDAAGYIAGRNRELAAEEALDYLGRSTAPVHGDAPYRMSFQRWEAEARELEYGLRNYPDDLDPNALDRLDELIPEYLDEPGTSYEELYTRIVHTARLAGEDVPNTSVVPWADDIAPRADAEYLDALVAAGEEAGL